MRILTEVPGGVTLNVRVQPKGATDGIVGYHGDALKVRVTKPPVGGEANEAVIRVIARALGVKRGLVDIRVGHRSRQKTLFVEGITLAEAEEALRRLDLA